MGDWRSIETAPKDGSHFLAWCVDTVDELDEDDCVIVRGKKEAYAVVAYYVFGAFVQMPWNGGIVQNRQWTHWMPLPKGPTPHTDKEG